MPASAAAVRSLLWRPAPKTPFLPLTQHLLVLLLLRTRVLQGACPRSPREASLPKRRCHLFTHLLLPPILRPPPLLTPSHLALRHRPAHRSTTRWRHHTHLLFPRPPLLGCRRRATPPCLLIRASFPSPTCIQFWTGDQHAEPVAPRGLRRSGDKPRARILVGHNAHLLR